MIRAARRARLGASVVQVAVVLAVITAAIFASVQYLGTTSRDDLDQTATEVGDPSSLVGRFGSGSQESGDSGEESGGGDDDWLNR